MGITELHTYQEIMTCPSFEFLMKVVKIINACGGFSKSQDWIQLIPFWGYPTYGSLPKWVGFLPKGSWKCGQSPDNLTPVLV